MSQRLSIVVALVSVSPLLACPGADEKIEVCVVSILASEHHSNVPARLMDFAKHVQKKDPALTGFQVDRAQKSSLKLGETWKVPLVGGETVEVTVNKERDEDGKVVLSITPPKLRELSYKCVCDKYFPIATQHFVGKGKDRQQVFIAIMAKPCGLKPAVPKK